MKRVRSVALIYGAVMVGNAKMRHANVERVIHVLIVVRKAFYCKEVFTLYSNLKTLKYHHQIFDVTACIECIPNELWCLTSKGTCENGRCKCFHGHECVRRVSKFSSFQKFLICLEHPLYCRHGNLNTLNRVVKVIHYTLNHLM